MVKESILRSLSWIEGHAFTIDDLLNKPTPIGISLIREERQATLIGLVPCIPVRRRVEKGKVKYGIEWL